MKDKIKRESDIKLNRFDYPRPSTKLSEPQNMANSTPAASIRPVDTLLYIQSGFGEFRTIQSMKSNEMNGLHLLLLC